MKMLREYSQGQMFLLPPSPDEFVPENQETRIINDVVDTTDLSPMLARYKGGGASAYHPAMMLKVIIYAYSRDIYSSRITDRELKPDAAFMFLSDIQSPDFRTFYRSRAEVGRCTSGFVCGGGEALCSFRNGRVGTYHLRWRQVTGKCLGETDQRKRWPREGDRAHQGADERNNSGVSIDALEDQEYPDGDGSEVAEKLRRKEYRLKTLQEAIEGLKREKLEKVSVTDPESLLMRDSQKMIRPSYNGQIAVDDSQNATDHVELRPLSGQVERDLGVRPEEGSSDAGYSSYDSL
jgi:hypothetical protein